jgi:hypothetical protein
MGGHRATELVDFRRRFYTCLSRWGDALFELADAALCGTGAVSSVPSLSLEAEFTRSHGSLYKALAKGRIDEEGRRALLVEQRPRDWPEIFAVDTSVWDRVDAQCSPERGYYYSASRHTLGRPVVAGWAFSWICQLSFCRDSWTAPLDVERISPLCDPVEATIAQIRRLLGHLGASAAVPLCIFDAGYRATALAEGLAADRVQILCRIQEDRVFYRDPAPVPAGSRPRGRPVLHGQRIKCSDRASWPEPSEVMVTNEPTHGTVRVSAWHDVHPKVRCAGRFEGRARPPIVRGSVILVEVERLTKPRATHKKMLWLFWAGPGAPDLDVVWRAYLRRFDIEHTFRFMKTTLGWTAPSLRTPGQAERWTWLVVAMLTQLRLARRDVEDLRLPWERRRDVSYLTPARTRRAFRRLRAHLGTPASAPKSTRAGPGRPRGSTSPPRERHPPIKRARSGV